MPGNFFLDELGANSQIITSLHQRNNQNIQNWRHLLEIGVGSAKRCQFLHRLWNFSNSEFSPMHFCLQRSACPLKSSNIKDSPLKQTGPFFLAMKSTTFHFYKTTKSKSEHLEISIPKSAPSKINSPVAHPLGISQGSRRITVRRSFNKITRSVKAAGEKAGPAKLRWRGDLWEAGFGGASSQSFLGVADGIIRYIYITIYKNVCYIPPNFVII